MHSEIDINANEEQQLGEEQQTRKEHVMHCDRALSANVINLRRILVCIGVPNSSLAELNIDQLTGALAELGEGGVLSDNGRLNALVVATNVYRVVRDGNPVMLGKVSPILFEMVMNTLTVDNDSRADINARLIHLFNLAATAGDTPMAAITAESLITKSIVMDAIDMLDYESDIDTIVKIHRHRIQFATPEVAGNYQDSLAAIFQVLGSVQDLIQYVRESDNEEPIEDNELVDGGIDTGSIPTDGIELADYAPLDEPVAEPETKPVVKAKAKAKAKPVAKPVAKVAEKPKRTRKTK